MADTLTIQQKAQQRIMKVIDWCNAGEISDEEAVQQIKSIREIERQELEQANQLAQSNLSQIQASVQAQLQNARSFMRPQPTQPQPAAPAQQPAQPQPAAPAQQPAQPQPASTAQQPVDPLIQQMLNQPRIPGRQPQPTAHVQQPVQPAQQPAQPQPAAPAQQPAQPQPAAPAQQPAQPQPAAPAQQPVQPVQPASPAQQPAQPGQPQPAPTGPQINNQALTGMDPNNARIEALRQLPPSQLIVRRRVVASEERKLRLKHNFAVVSRSTVYGIITIIGAYAVSLINGPSALSIAALGIGSLIAMQTTATSTKNTKWNFLNKFQDWMKDADRKKDIEMYAQEKKEIKDEINSRGMVR